MLIAFLHQRLSLFKSSPVRRRITHGAIWGGLATASSRAINVVASYILARVLGPIGFGEYGMVNSTSAMVGSLAGLGIGLAVTKYLAQYRKSDKKKIGRIIALSSVITIVSAIGYGLGVIAIAPWLAKTTLAAPHLSLMIQISAITISFGVINGLQSSLLAGVEAFRANTYILLLTSIVQSILLVVGAWLWGLLGAVVALALGIVLTVIMTHWAVLREMEHLDIRICWADAGREWPFLLHFSLPTVLTNISIGPITWACNAFLVNQIDGYAQLGVLNAATQWQGAVQIVPGVIGTAMIPILSERIGAQDRIGAKNLMIKMMGVNAIAVLPLAFIVSLLSPLIMSGYGPSFGEGYFTLVILCATAAISTIVSGPTSQFFVAEGRMWMTLLLNLVASMVLIVSSYFFAHWGAEGIAVAKLFSSIMHAVLFYFFSIKKD